MVKIALGRVNYSQVYRLYDNGRTYEQRDILLPYNLLVLATAICKTGVDIKIFDAEIQLWDENQLADEILKWKPDFVGLTATTPDIEATIDVCRLIKKRNNLIKTIIGGSHVTAVSCSNKDVDFVVRGRGEDELAQILNIKSRRVGRVNYNLIDLNDYMFTDPLKGRIKTATIMSMYGCPFDCSFCFHSKDIIYRDTEDFIREIGLLYDYEDVRYFYIYDDTFLLDKTRRNKILDALKRFKEAHFQCLVRASLIDRDVVLRLRDANFVRVSMGLESGSDEILKKISKGITKEDGERACRELSKEGIETRASFILGLPYETHKTIEETIEFAKNIELYNANFNILTPYPGTKVYEMAVAGEGLKFKQDSYKTDWKDYKRWGKAIIETDDLKAEDLEEYQIKAQVEFYARGKILDYYYSLFGGGNLSRYFYRPLNFAWRNKFNTDVPFWDKLEDTALIEVSNAN